MKPDLEMIRELAALHALGALEGEDERKFSRLLAENPEAAREAAAFGQVSESLAKSLPQSPGPSPELKTKLLRAAERLSAKKLLEQQLQHLRRKQEMDSLFFAMLRDLAGCRCQSQAPM